MGVLWKLEPATAAKHRLYQRYLDAWWPILLQTSQSTGYSRPRVTLLDAFAGPGRYEDGEPGSPVFILDRLLGHHAVDRMHLSPRRVHLIFIEKDRARHEHLVAELVSRFGPLKDLPVRVEVRRGEAGRDSLTVLDELGAWGHPILGIFDSWGSVNVPLHVMSRIARNRSSEVITTFGPNWFSRREELNADILDTVFGGRGFWTAAADELGPDEKWRVWLRTYRDALRRAGFGYQLQFELVPRTGQPLYLVFGTGSTAGLKAMKDAMWKVDGLDGESFRDPRTRGAKADGQLDLFQAAGLIDDELAELVAQRLGAGATTVEAIGEWLLTETARWMPKHALQAARQMRQDGVIAVQSPGKLTTKSLISLQTQVRA
ncbi:three-Cys-motif partner protein TcmP [Streptomyces stelliscabiei]|uniref:Three-Cys-motif partner protein n=1 Tax=Streptomyces stelliscabiei TaxID=146820 RepID=A0A8I0PDN2_9ACTN|nr:three-Cys-motif partner protein TcmP [Streptomyces stelliscabiei]MBE1602980.1 three-Cys-motif partner protein [Streptomyces stelliscabiei]MDX2521695.1 three-Cys-motif partner protein TcmP [Streptomyces stelliscabiei]